MTIALAAFENAMVVVTVLGGSTNAVLHLIAMARSVGVELGIDDFQKVSDRIPYLADLKPSGQYVMQDVHEVGGTPALHKMLLELKRRLTLERMPEAESAEVASVPIELPDPRDLLVRRAAIDGVEVLRATAIGNGDQPGHTRAPVAPIAFVRSAPIGPPIDDPVEAVTPPHPLDHRTIRTAA